MAINWKAVLVGAVVTIVLGIVLGMAYSVLAYLGPVLGGLIAVWFAKTKNMKDAAIVGLLAGLVGAVVEGVLFFTALSSVAATIGMAVSSPTTIAMMAVFGLVLGLVGGGIGSFVVKK